MPPLLAGNLVALFCMVLWASSFPITGALLADWHPLLLTPARLVPGSIVILLASLAAGHGKAVRRAPWRRILLFGGLGMGMGTTLLVFALNYANPVTVAIITTTFPLVSAVMGYFGGSERVTLALGLGIACAIAGGVLLSFEPGSATLDLRGGEILALLSVFLWAWFARGAVLSLGDLPDLARAACTMLAASLMVSLVAAGAFLAGAVEPRYDLSLDSIGLLLWLGVIANGVTMVLWMTASRLLGVTVAGIHLNGVPFYVILMALAVGGTIFAQQVWGACLVALGALLAQLPARRARCAALPLRD